MFYKLKVFFSVFLEFIVFKVAQSFNIMPGFIGF